MAGNSYIIKFKEGSTDEEVTQLKKDLTDSGAEITHEYSLIKGIAVTLPEDQVTTLESNPHVDLIEKDQEVHIS
ncbi:uncharacterized protein V2V93DRAFT_362027 [Kockiozyma suomiensis]|uniref:uncharacterized protein n=1 Tax=Kockiozyma suomiensis TaxID=1337062 RepID=UPI0033434693